MKKMKEILKEEYPLLLTYGCSAHYLNLVEKQVTPSFLAHLIEVNKYFRNHHQPRGWLLDDRNGVMPQLPNDTRWNSQVDCLKTYIKNYSHYLDIIEKHEGDIKHNIKKIIDNAAIFREAKNLQIQLEKCEIALDKVDM
nr:uncharacterized protein LOC124810984 [Hydra vulgaris]